MAALVNLKLNVNKRHGGQEHITSNYHITSYHIMLYHCYIIFHHITSYCMTSPMLFVANRLYLPSPPELLTTKADLKGPHFVIASDPAYGHRSQRRLYIGEIGSNICQMCVYYLLNLLIIYCMTHIFKWHQMAAQPNPCAKWFPCDQISASCSLPRIGKAPGSKACWLLHSSKSAKDLSFSTEGPKPQSLASFKACGPQLEANPSLQNT